MVQYRGIISQLREVVTPEFLRENGFKRFIIKIMEITSIYRRVILVQRDLNEPIPKLSAKVPIAIAVLKSDEVDEFAAFCARNHPDLTEAAIRGRLDSGWLCFVARHKGTIVHASWAIFNVFHLHYLKMLMHLDSDEVYLDDMLTAPEYRNKHIARARVAWTFAYLRDAGYSRVIGDAIPENDAAQRSTLTLGFRETGLLVRILLGPLKITLYKPRPENS
jgi:GNAT superfamily N-acetyltransferase